MTVRANIVDRHFGPIPDDEFTAQKLLNGPVEYKTIPAPAGCTNARFEIDKDEIILSHLEAPREEIRITEDYKMYLDDEEIPLDGVSSLGVWCVFACPSRVA